MCQLGNSVRIVSALHFFGTLLFDRISSKLCVSNLPSSPLSVLFVSSDDRIAKHQVVGAKAATRKPRRPFPSSEEMRLKGTDFMEYKDCRTDVSVLASLPYWVPIPEQ